MITDLRLQNFRSYTDDSFELAPGVNIIVGPNASGKTNLLEAVLVAARGSSYRAKDAELVQYDKPWSRIDAHDEQEGLRTVKLECSPESGSCKKSFEIDGKPYQRLSQQKSLPIVLFEPNHLLLLSGSPDLRRTYLDDLLEQIVPGFGTARRQYRRVLAQRNALLKQGREAAVVARQIFVWDVRLSELAGKVVRQRLELIDRINQGASAIYADISRTGSRGRKSTGSSAASDAGSRAEVRLEYVSALNTSNPNQYESALLHRLEQSLERDCLLGFTANGPHRDDIRVLLGGRASQESASRGEIRTIVLTLKILELQLLQAAFSHKDQSPLLLLDDVFSELDGARRHALTSFLQPHQTFITTTDADLVVQHFTESCHIIPLSTG